jgi:hypothetical protein
MGGRDPNSLKFNQEPRLRIRYFEISSIYILFFSGLYGKEPAQSCLVVLSTISESGLLGRAAAGIHLCSLLAQIRLGKIGLITAGVLDRALPDGTSKYVA